MPKPKCLCTGRTDIRCDGEHCDLASPPGKTCKNCCIICWQYLHSEPHRRLWGEDSPPLPKPEVPMVIQTTTGTATKEPGIIRKAASIIKATAQHVTQGLPMASSEEVQRRITICEGCPDFIHDRRACRRCGCSMQIKATWKEQKCPIGKW